MATIVMLGGNGYIGRHTTLKWLEKNSTAQFYVLSRSGKNSLVDPRVHTLKADVSDYQSVKSVLPDQVDYIVDFVGRPEKDPEVFKQVNNKPAEVMQKIAEEKGAKAMGFVGGTFGPKSFVNGKKAIMQDLEKSSVRLEVVEPTVVYGADRNDAISKMVPLLKVFGIFFKQMKPVTVDAVASELVTKLTR